MPAGAPLPSLQPLAPAGPIGLSSAEAAARLQRDGFNEVPSARRRPLLLIVFDVVREPMFLLLIASAAVYFLLGDPEEAAALLGAVCLVIGITLYQEHKTERTLEALRDLSSPRVLAVRDGVVARIPGREVVRGDVVLLREGDRVPADGTLESSTNLLVDESLLTGESVPVAKRARSSIAAGRTEDGAAVFSGTLVVAGEGVATIAETGIGTEIGKIGASLNTLEVGHTALQREMNGVVRVLAVAGLGACVVLAVAYGAAHAWLDGALAGLTLAISMVPEEFPVVFTVFLALGAWRISRSNVLTRRVPAIETLGSARVLCVDKTGTLTMNRMRVAAVVAGGRVYPAPAAGEGWPREAVDVLAVGAMASRIDAFDPMERAIADSAREAGLAAPAPSELVREYPLSDTQAAVGYAWRGRRGGSAHEIAVKGAPETVLPLCALTGGERDAALEQVERMARDGFRVIAAASATWPRGPLPASLGEFSCAFAGLLALADPVRPGVAEAVQECRHAGIRVVMITGDHPATALSIAARIGLLDTQVLTGADIAAMSEDDLRRHVQTVDVCARITPRQKLRLVQALQANGDVVAMTGDGVNDAPALKAADIGIAMGGRGTDVAREAAALVLIDDDFTSIVKAVRLGRRIFANIEKATAYVLAVHVPIAGVALLPVLFGWPLMLMPLHVILVELIVDPASTVAFEMEPEERDVMARPPREPAARLFTRRLIVQSLLQGLGAFAAAGLMFAASARIGLGERDVRMLTFATLIASNFALIVANRSLTDPIWITWRRPNPALRWMGLAAACILAVVLYVPAAGEVFRVASPHGLEPVAIVGASGAALLWMEGVKRAVTRRAGTPPRSRS